MSTTRIWTADAHHIAFLIGTDCQITEVFLIQISDCLLIELVAGHIINVKVLSVTGEDGLGTVQNKLGGVHGEVWQENALDFIRFFCCV